MECSRVAGSRCAPAAEVPEYIREGCIFPQSILIWGATSCSSSELTRHCSSPMATRELNFEWRLL